MDPGLFGLRGFQGARIERKGFDLRSEGGGGVNVQAKSMFQIERTVAETRLTPRPGRGAGPRVKSRPQAGD